MLMLLSMSVLGTVTVYYLGRKVWLMLHQAVGITPGALSYQNPNTPLLTNALVWKILTVNKQHLLHLSDRQLRQLQAIDSKVATYRHCQQSLAQQNITAMMTEQQFILHKLLQTRLPEMLASHHHLVSVSTSNNKRTEARKLLQTLLDNIEQRLESLVAQMENTHLQDLRVMKQYLDSHDK